MTFLGLIPIWKLLMCQVYGTPTSNHSDFSVSNERIVAWMQSTTNPSVYDPEIQQGYPSSDNLSWYEVALNSTGIRRDVYEYCAPYITVRYIGSLLRVYNASSELEHQFDSAVDAFHSVVDVATDIHELTSLKSLMESAPDEPGRLGEATRTGLSRVISQLNILAGCQRAFDSALLEEDDGGNVEELVFQLLDSHRQLTNSLARAIQVTVNASGSVVGLGRLIDALAEWRAPARGWTLEAVRWVLRQAQVRLTELRGSVKLRDAFAQSLIHRVVLKDDWGPGDPLSDLLRWWIDNCRNSATLLSALHQIRRLPMRCAGRAASRELVQRLLFLDSQCETIIVDDELTLRTLDGRWTHFMGAKSVVEAINVFAEFDQTDWARLLEAMPENRPVMEATQLFNAANRERQRWWSSSTWEIVQRWAEGGRDNFACMEILSALDSIPALLALYLGVAGRVVPFFILSRVERLLGRRVARPTKSSIDYIDS